MVRIYINTIFILASKYDKPAIATEPYMWHYFLFTM